MSSKFEMSAAPSALESCDEELYEEDFEDLEPLNSGGESGVVETVVISSPMTVETKVRGRPKEGCAALGGELIAIGLTGGVVDRVE